MAKSRMISTAVVRSAKFQKMSAGAQALYLQFVADADDMGVAEGESILACCPKVRKPSLTELIESGFVTVIDENGTIVYINDFHTVNSFSKHGANPSIYMDELLQNCCTKKLINKVKIKRDGFPMICNDISGEAMEGDVVVCNAEMYDMYVKDHPEINDYEALRDVLREWYEYTDEVGKGKTSNVSISKMIKNAIKRCDDIGEYEVVEYISTAISNAWNNISWDWFDNKPFK